MYKIDGGGGGSTAQVSTPKPPAPPPAPKPTATPTATPSSHPAVQAYQGQSGFDGCGATPASTPKATPGPTPVPTLNPTEQKALDEVNGATQQVEDLQGKVDDLNDQLAGEMSKFAEALTPAQREAYTQQFQSEHPEYKQLEQASQKLSDVLAKNSLCLENVAGKSSSAQDGLFHALSVGAESAGSAKGVLGIIGDIYAKKKAGFTGKDFGPLLKDALPLAAASLAGTSADTQEAFSKLSEIVKPIVELEGKSGEVGKAWQALGEASKGKFSLLSKLGEDFEKDSGLAKGLKAAALVFGAKEGVDAAGKGDYLKAVNALASSSKGGLELMAGATKALADSSKFFATVNKSGFAKFAEKLIPGLGLVVSATATGMDIATLAKHGDDPGNYVKVVGDVISVTGSLMEAIPGGELPGGLIDAVGGFISAGGDLISGLFKGSELEKARRQHLTDICITGNLQDTLVHASSDRLHELSDGMNLSPEQIQQLATRYPKLIDNDNGNGYVIDSLQTLAKTYGMSPGQTVDFLNRIGQGSNDPDGSLYSVAANLQHATAAFPETRARYEEILTGLIDDSALPASNAGYRNALAYLQSLDQTHVGH